MWFLVVKKTASWKTAQVIAEIRCDGEIVNSSKRFIEKRKDIFFTNFDNKVYEYVYVLLWSWIS